VSYDELMSFDAETFWKPLFYSQNLLVIKDISSSLLSDSEFFNLIRKFGKPWNCDKFKILYPQDRYSRLFGNKKPEDMIVSHLRSNNTPWGNNILGYHADIPLPQEVEYPCRGIYMANTPNNDTGSTTWLNLEYAWEQCTEEEKTTYNSVEVIMHDILKTDPVQIRFPFLKTNPKTGKVSPRLNGCGPEGAGGWIHHIEIDSCILTFTESVDFVEKMYNLLENKKDTLYKHNWENGDIIIFNNWFNVHMRDAVDEDSSCPRELRQITFDL